eukprot:scaffold11507_cov67-Isochrysis_galbana.AAC.1
MKKKSTRGVQYSRGRHASSREVWTVGSACDGAAGRGATARSGQRRAQWGLRRWRRTSTAHAQPAAGVLWCRRRWRLARRSGAQPSVSGPSLSPSTGLRHII